MGQVLLFPELFCVVLGSHIHVGDVIHDTMRHSMSAYHLLECICM